MNKKEEAKDGVVCKCTNKKIIVFSTQEYREYLIWCKANNLTIDIWENAHKYLKLLEKSKKYK